MSNIIIGIIVLIFSLPVVADSNTLKCNFEEKTAYSEDKGDVDYDLSELIKQARIVHELSDEAQIKVITTYLDCNDLNSDSAFVTDYEKGGSGLPACAEVGCVIGFPSTANRITMVFCESRVKTTIKYKKMPDGRYEIIEVHQELVTECTLDPEDGGGGPE